MKKFTIFTSFMLSITCFTFWEVEGPFISQVTKPNVPQEPMEPCPSLAFTKYIAHPEYKLNDYFSETKRNVQYIVFLYDQYTNYLFSSTPTNQMHTLKDNLLSFSNKKIDYINGQFFSITKPLCSFLKFSNTFSLRKGTIDFSVFNPFLCPKNLIAYLRPPLEKNFSSFSLKQKITTDSGVKIKNPNFNELESPTSFPILSKNGKEISFQNALKKYFNKDNHYTAMATAITQSKYLDSKKPFVYEIGKAVSNITRVGKKEVERLNNSTILTIYSVSKDTLSKIEKKQKENSIIFGLAQDDTTPEKRKFFYVTDLESDISILLNQH